jgi:hypothetical protein
MKLDNLLIVAGSGRNSGKTTIICRLIEQFSHLGITAVKISPHFHKPSDGLIPYSEKPGFEIFQETNSDTFKDSSRMLKGGAERVFYIQTREEFLKEGFADFYSNLAPDKPVICESPALIKYITPGLFIIMISPAGSTMKNMEEINKYPHLEFTYEEVLRTENLPFDFTDSGWNGIK